MILAEITVGHWTLSDQNFQKCWTNIAICSDMYNVQELN